MALIGSGDPAWAQEELDELSAEQQVFVAEFRRTCEAGMTPELEAQFGAEAMKAYCACGASAIANNLTVEEIIDLAQDADFMNHPGFRQAISGCIVKTLSNPAPGK